jgi:hypothetical protein
MRLVAAVPGLLTAMDSTLTLTVGRRAQEERATDAQQMHAGDRSTQS